ncbi:MAG: hypothetical protein HY231_26965 [Acidobacteria bacterium]|nr:hypothetical protein [Acidobacteriota bacterium]
MLVEFIESPLGFLKAIFEFKQPQNVNQMQSRRLRIVLNINWMDQQPPSLAELAEIRKLIDNCSHALTEPVHCADCYWHNIMTLIHRCHEQSRQFSQQIVTNIHIEEAVTNAPRPVEVAEVVSDQANVANRPFQIH